MQSPSHGASFACGRSDAPLGIIMFHGYTSSPDELQELAETLARRFDAEVTVPLLPGHGTREEDLLNITFDDLLGAARRAVREETTYNRPFALLGHSMGGYLALISIEEKMPSALIITATPFVLQPRFRRPWMPYLMRARKFWDKEVLPVELKMRRHLFFYPHMPGVALSFVKRGIRESERFLPRVACPILTIHTAGDSIAESDSGERILALSGHNPLNKAIVFDSALHSLYYGPHHRRTSQEISGFLEGIF